MTRPTILLGMPHVHDIFKTVEANLRYHGFEVINIVEDDQAFRYPSLWTRLHTKFRQHILGDKDAKRRIKAQILQHPIGKKLQAHQGADYALFISGDIYHPDLLAFIHPHIHQQMVNYQWDGLARFPAIWQCIPEFDRFYVFDSDDLAHPPYHFLPATNFYFDHDLDTLPPTNSSFYFTGTHQANRAAIITNFAYYAEQAQWELDFRLVWAHNRDLKQARQAYPCPNIQITHRGDSFQNNLHRAKQAKVLVDFVTDAHKGLSFRTFEALGYQKKLITTNPHTMDYDFYHPNNIYILTPNNLDGIPAFLHTPYHTLANDIREKYSFGNWIKYVLQIHPHIPIQLPPKSTP